jgi:hypothetical protein
MDHFATLQPMAATAMACRGCAAKLGAAPLMAALARLDPDGQPAPVEDAARVGTGADGALLLQSVDGFPALVDDPWLNARLTTLHACSDLWASGAAVQSVQALVTVPEAAAAIQEELLLQTLAGVRSVLQPLGKEVRLQHQRHFSPPHGALGRLLRRCGLGRRRLDHLGFCRRQWRRKAPLDDTQRTHLDERHERARDDEHAGRG